MILLRFLNCKNLAKQYMNKAKKYRDEAEIYRDEILKLVGISKASSKACIDTSKIINTDKDSIDEKITEETIRVMDNNDSIDEKITEETIKVMDNNDRTDEKITEETIKVMDNNDRTDKKITEETIKVMDNNDSIDENRVAIFEDSKPNLNKDTEPNIKINKKTLLQVFKTVRKDIRNGKN